MHRPLLKLSNMAIGIIHTWSTQRKNNILVVKQETVVFNSYLCENYLQWIKNEKEKNIFISTT